MRKALAVTLFLLLGIAVPASAAEQAAAGAPTDKKKSAVHKITQSASYLMLDPIYTSIMDGSRPLGLLMVGIGLDVPDATLRERVDRDMPQLRDAYLRALLAFTGTAVRPDRQPDVADMADRLQRVTDRLLARKGARVLLAQVAIRLNR